MSNYFKTQLFALFFLSMLLIVVILRTPAADIQVIELTNSINKGNYKDIVRDSQFWVSTSKDPYIVLPKVKVIKLDNSFLHIKVDYSGKLCQAEKGEPASFIQVYWKAINQSFSEDKSDAAPISLSRSDYLIPLRSLSKKSSTIGKSENLAFRIDTVNKLGCRFKLNRIALGIFR